MSLSPLRRGFVLAASCLALAAVLLAPSPLSSFDRPSSEATLWQLLNGARTNNGMAPLQQHSTLIELARWRSVDMLAKDYFSHTVAGCGCLVYASYDAAGLSYNWAGENIGWNSGLDDAYSAVRVHERFMASAGHRANVLDSRFTHGGVGARSADGQMFQGFLQNTRMYTELFLQASGATPSAPAPAAPAPRQRPAGGSPASPTPAARDTAPTPAPAPQPQPVMMEMDAPQRPSSTKIDGVSVRVSQVRPLYASRFTPE